jgi:uncharacterized membrane protein YdjX (TVP38/TMEM64 family)
MGKVVYSARSQLTLVPVVALLAIVSLLGLFWDVPFQKISVFFGGNILLTALVLFIALAFATVVAPVTALPLIPIAASVVHPALVAFVTVLAWTVGAVIAFLIARTYGRPLALHFVKEDTLLHYESAIPPHLEFVTLILLRMTIPVDILSYAVGVISRISLVRYTIATVIGITPFAILFSYGSTAAWEGEYVWFVVFVLGGIVLYTTMYYLLVRQHRRGAPRDVQ